MFGFNKSTNHDGVMKRLNEKIRELEEFVATNSTYRSDYEIKRAKMMIQELNYIKTGKKR